jgi:hypothetical protein
MAKFGIDSNMVFDADGKSVAARLSDHDGTLDDHTTQLAENSIDVNNIIGSKYRMTFNKNQLGVNIQNPMDLSTLQSKFNLMKDIGIHNIVLCPQGNLATSTSTDITEDTISYATMETYIQTCLNAGFNVYLKCHIECKDGTWRANIAPSNVDTFFTNYQAFIVKYATLAEKYKLPIFCLGEEMVSISGETYRSKWIDITNTIRGVYTGKLTYGANLIVWDDEHRRNVVYDYVDYLGIDCWSQAATGANPDNLNIYNQINGWLIPTFEELYNTYGKKIIFTEIGYFPTPYGIEQPGNVNQPDWTINYQQHANIYNMIFKNFIGQEWFQDLWYWAETNNSYSTSGSPDRYSVLVSGNTPTQNVFKKFKEVQQ